MTTAIIGLPTEDGFSSPGFFTGPFRTYTAETLEQVLPLTHAVDAEARAGSWIVVMLSYEAAPAFDPAFKVHSPAEFPLAWAAVFAGPSSQRLVTGTGNDRLQELTPTVTPSQFAVAVARIRELIACGDTYQVNYTFPLTSSFTGNPLSWYQDLCEAQLAQFPAYLDLGRYKVLSLSPELFFERRGDSIKTRPMKGTINRGRWVEEDDEMAQRLFESEKDRAENVMIVDLLRNDLGKIARPGTVQVSRLFDLERYPTLWQMTSTVEAKLQPGVGLPQIMAALFPCGSITGAPKIRTMEIIRELEPSPRNAYTGAIGVVRPGGDCTFNVAIRTLLLDSETGKVSLGVGGGITYDSNAESEYQECLLKSSFVQRQVNEFQLLETMLVENGDIFLLEHHISRIRSSAEYFGFQFDEKRVLEELMRLAAHHSEGDWKIRLLLDKKGEFRTQLLEVESHRPVVRATLAAKPVDKADPFFYHKTTQRSVYTDRLAIREDCDDQIFWNESGEITESTIANVVVSLDGKFWTPPRTSGLLAGTFREELLRRGEIRERVITIEELKTAKDFFLINSVRRWMPAVLVSDTL